MQKEVFKDIPGYEGIYQVSNLGNVKSLSRNIYKLDGTLKKISKNILLKLFLDDKGYYMVKLYNNNSKKTFKVHKLVAITFLNHTPNKYELVVDHINNIRTDNRVENLQLITNRENCIKDKKVGSSRYTGVSWKKTINKWESKIQLNKINYFLGYFKSELEAHKAYEERYFKYLNDNEKAKR